MSVQSTAETDLAASQPGSDLLPPGPNPPMPMPTLPVVVGKGKDISYSQMGLIIGLVLGALFLVFMLVLAYILIDYLRDKKRKRRLARRRSGGSGRSGGGAAPSAPEPEGSKIPGLPEGQTWTTVHDGIVGLELVDDGENSSGGGSANGGGTSSRNRQSQRPSAGSGGGAEAVLAMIRNAWASASASMCFWDWRKQVSSPLAPLVDQQQSGAATPSRGTSGGGTGRAGSQPSTPGGSSPRGERAALPQSPRDLPSQQPPQAQPQAPAPPTLPPVQEQQEHSSESTTEVAAVALVVAEPAAAEPEPAVGPAVAPAPLVQQQQTQQQQVRQKPSSPPPSPSPEPLPAPAPSPMAVTAGSRAVLVSPTTLRTINSDGGLLMDNAELHLQTEVLHFQLSAISSRSNAAWRAASRIPSVAALAAAPAVLKIPVAAPAAIRSASPRLPCSPTSPGGRSSVSVSLVKSPGRCGGHGSCVVSTTPRGGYGVADGKARAHARKSLAAGAVGGSSKEGISPITQRPRWRF
ncbi:hypothetical protein GPECTOR_36g64 [Gonium pectorale]|uniref:Uncharacterized protein n=1 Tax=Gonium pectorale TaxID=33097 RepID=A0A150GDC4_GONPE|nr:hypothetical protein GPECTOR_36g64 [Gonium pectorale]|eukprot:KXZ47340.1 hypothetical protein GPECTOR_36g64 [Gonium pectorale]